jgi:hypothetical protein
MSKLAVFDVPTMLGNILAKAATLRITLNLDGTPIV